MKIYIISIICLINAIIAYHYHMIGILLFHAILAMFLGCIAGCLADMQYIQPYKHLKIWLKGN